jgi:hypothetical protein
VSKSSAQRPGAEPPRHIRATSTTLFNAAGSSDGMDSSRCMTSRIMVLSGNRERDDNDRRSPMTHHATTVAVDLSMTVFEIGIADRRWRLVERRRLNRRQFARFLAEQPASHIVMEACGTAHHWGAWRRATVIG